MIKRMRSRTQAAGNKLLSGAHLCRKRPAEVYFYVELAYPYLAKIVNLDRIFPSVLWNICNITYLLKRQHFCCNQHTCCAFGRTQRLRHNLHNKIPAPLLLWGPLFCPFVPRIAIAVVNCLVTNSCLRRSVSLSLLLQNTAGPVRGGGRLKQNRRDENKKSSSRCLALLLQFSTRLFKAATSSEVADRSNNRSLRDEPYGYYRTRKRPLKSY